MNHWVMRAPPQLLPVITTMSLFLPGAAWAQARRNRRFGSKGRLIAGLSTPSPSAPTGRRSLCSGGQNDQAVGCEYRRLIRSLPGTAEQSVRRLQPRREDDSFGSEDKTIKLWQVSTGKHIRSFNGHTGNVYSVAFSPDGKTLASSSEEGNDSALRLWDVNTGRPSALEKRNTWVTSVAFSPDGKTIATGRGTGRQTWDVSTGNLIRSLPGHRNTIHSVAFSPDGKTLVQGAVTIRSNFGT